MSSLDSSQRKWVHERLLVRDGPHCFYCGVFTERGNRRCNPTIDHMLPECRGGSHEMENLCIACVPCNRNKGEMTSAEFLASPILARRLADLGRRQKFTHSELSWTDSGDWSCVCGKMGDREESPTFVPCDVAVGRLVVVA